MTDEDRLEISDALDNLRAEIFYLRATIKRLGKLKTLVAVLFGYIVYFVFPLYLAQISMELVRQLGEGEINSAAAVFGIVAGFAARWGLE